MKKGIRILSLILSVMMVFAVISAAAEGSAAARDAIEIKEVDVTVTQPKAGTQASKDSLPEIVVPDGAPYEVEARCWYHENGTYSEVSDLEEFTFQADKSYTLWFTLKASAGYYFSNKCLMAINGALQVGELDIYTTDDYSYSAFHADASVRSVQAMPELTGIENAAITVTPPKAGTTSKTEPVIDVAPGSNFSVEACCWNQEDGTHAEVNDLKEYTFAGGKTYTLWVTLKANEGYELDSGTKLTVSNGKQEGEIITYTSPDGSYSCLTANVSVTIEQEQTEKYTLTLDKVTVSRSAKKLVLSATLKLNGKPVKGEQVTFEFNGKKYCGKTSAKGVAKVTIKKNVLKKLKVGKKITIKAIFGDITVKRSVKVKK